MKKISAIFIIGFLLFGCEPNEKTKIVTIVTTDPIEEVAPPAIETQTIITDSDLTFVYDTLKLKDVVAIVSTSYSPNKHRSYSCNSSVQSYLKGKLIDEIKYSKIEAVGGDAGIFFSFKNENQIVLNKRGDYDGRTIIINSDGKLTDIVGGRDFSPTSEEIFLSIYDSDLSEFSLYDLKNDSLIFDSGEIEKRPKEFYSEGQRYFGLFVDDETGTESVWEIEYDMDRIMQLDLVKSDLNGYEKHELIESIKLGIQSN